MQHSLADFKIDCGDASKLYELDGVEYDGKGVRELIAKLKVLKEEGPKGIEGDTPERLLHTLLLTVRA